MRLDPQYPGDQPAGPARAHTPPGPSGGKKRRCARQRGAETIEFTLIMLPMLGFTFLFLDIAWAIYARAALQYAVREGVRYAVTSQVITGKGQVDSIKSTVQDSSLGILTGQTGLNTIQVHFYSPDTFTEVTGAGANAGGNLVQVSVEAFAWAPMAPLLRSSAALQFTARSMDRMEASPSTGPPTM